MRVEFKLPPAGNNGIAIRTPVGGHPSTDGFEIQIIDNDGYNAKHPGAHLKDYQYHGSLYHCAGGKPGYLRPVGEWNYQELEVRGQKIKVTLNGTKILDVDLDTFDRSQIETKPKGLDNRVGHIGLAGTMIQLPSAASKSNDSECRGCLTTSTTVPQRWVLISHSHYGSIIHGRQTAWPATIAAAYAGHGAAAC